MLSTPDTRTTKAHSANKSVQPRQKLRVMLDMMGVYDPVWSGMQEHICTLGTHLLDGGHEPILLLRADYPEVNRARIAAAKLRCIEVPAMMATHGEQAPLRRSLPALWRILRKEHIDVYHMHTNLCGGEVWAAAMARMASVAPVISYHVMPDIRPETRWRQLGMGAMHRFLRVQGIAVAATVGDMIQQRYHLQAGQLHVVYNGIDATRDYQLAKPRPDGSIVIGVVCRLSREKAVDVLLSAIAMLDRTLPFRVVMLGDGDQRSALERQAHDLAISDRIEFTGFVSDVDAHMPEFDMVVLPSRSGEAMPLAVIEAFAAARPVVATPIGGVPELVQPEVTGLLVPPDDPAALAASISRLLQDATLRRRLGAAARQRYESDLGADRMTADTVQVYRRALT